MTMTFPPAVPPRARLADIAADKPVLQPGPQAATPRAAPAADSAGTRQGTALQMGATLAAKGPPFDLETVARIKEAISEGRYPIDTKAIAESLFEGLSDLHL
jgi:negative regulator of flagellin synthesis FlgM